MTISIKQYQQSLDILKSKNMTFYDDIETDLVKVDFKKLTKALSILGYSNNDIVDIWNDEVRKACDVPNRNGGYIDTRYYNPKKIAEYALKNIIRKVANCYEKKLAKETK